MGLFDHMFPCVAQLHIYRQIQHKCLGANHVKSVTHNLLIKNFHQSIIFIQSDIRIIC